MGRQNKPKKIIAVFACYMLLTLNFNQLYASGPGSGGGGQVSGGSGTGGGGAKRNLASLKTVPVPGPTVAELGAVVQNKAAAIALGKAFFWEMQRRQHRLRDVPLQRGR
jgi:hypothetical protein